MGQVLTYREAVEAATLALCERAIADEDRLEAQSEVTDAEWDEALSVSHFINGEALCIDGPPHTLAAAVLSAVGYDNLLAEVARLRGSADAWRTEYDKALAEVERLRAHLLDAETSRDDWADLETDQRVRAEVAEATLARVKVEGDRWANSKNYTSQFAGGLLREALRSPGADDE